MVVTVIDIGGDACGGVGGPGGGFGGPEGGFSDSRGSGKPLLLLRLKKPPSGPRRPLFWQRSGGAVRGGYVLTTEQKRHRQVRTNPEYPRLIGQLIEQDAEEKYLTPRERRETTYTPREHG